MALQEAALTEAAVEVGYFCLAGADLPEDFVKLRQALEPLRLAASVVINNDTFAALRAGLSQPWGVVVICGTGFNAAGRAPDGREIRLPGLGPISGDWGGGGALAGEIIRAVMRAWDGRGQPTRLTDLVLEALDASDEESLLLALYRERIDDSALLGLVPLLFEAALLGDEVASNLIVQMGTEVGVSANALIRRLGLEELDVEVVLGGSVFKGRGPLLLDTASKVVHEQARRARIIPLRHAPVFGAALLALEAAGIAVSGAVYTRLDESVQALARYPQVEPA
jgi:N-acetylglucosamine kinase-like BadF-type ATPase